MRPAKTAEIHAPMINIRKLEADLWEPADLLRACSKLPSNQYCMLEGKITRVTERTCRLGFFISGAHNYFNSYE